MADLTTLKGAKLKRFNELASMVEEELGVIQVAHGRIGAYLIEAKAMINKGAFEQWLTEQGIERTYAYKTMRYVTTFGDIPASTMENISFTAASELSRPTCPDGSLRAALDVAASGNKVTVALAQELIELHTVEQSAEVDQGEDTTPTEPVADDKPLDVWHNATRDETAKNEEEPIEEVEESPIEFDEPMEEIKVEELPESNVIKREFDPVTNGIDLSALANLYDRVRSSIYQFGDLTDNEGLIVEQVADIIKKRMR